MEIYDTIHSTWCLGSLTLKNREGHTPIHLAAKKGNLLFLNNLIKYPETLSMKDKEEKNPLALAVENQHVHLSITSSFFLL